MKFLITHSASRVGPLELELITETFDSNEFGVFYENLFSYIRMHLPPKIIKHINSGEPIKDGYIDLRSNNIIGDYEVSIHDIKCINIKNIVAVMPCTDFMFTDFITPNISIFWREQTEQNKVFENLYVFCIRLLFINKVPITKELKQSIELEKSYTIVYPMIIDEQWKFPNDYAEFEKSFNALKLIAI